MFERCFNDYVLPTEYLNTFIWKNHNTFRMNSKLSGHMKDLNITN